VRLHWAGGTTTSGVVRHPIQYFENLSYYPQLEQRVLDLADQGKHPDGIAAQLNRDGFRLARYDGPIRHRVIDQILRRNGHSIPYGRPPRPADPAQAPREDEWWLPELAARLGCTTGTIRKWLREGHLTGRQETRPPRRWILLAPPAKITELHGRLERARGRQTRVHPRFADEPNGDIPQVHPA
jgi:hypothetical protein